MLLPLQLGIVRVLEHCRASFGCVEPVCAMREWARVAATSMPKFRYSPAQTPLPGSTLAAHNGFTGRRGDEFCPDHVVLGMLLNFLFDPRRSSRSA
jgi:hypothetical protein